jgi:DedD protein
VTQTHDTAEDGFHEIQLSGKQLVFLFMATTVVSVVIFLCGVLVGRGVRSGSELDQAAEPVAAAAEEPASADAGAPEPAAPPQPVSESELSYDKRLKEPAGQVERLKPSAPPEQPTVQAEQPAPKTEPAAKPEQAAPAATKPPARSGADVPTAGRAGLWLIQVHALKDREAASKIVQNLIAKGYPAFLATPPRGTPALYRVQIGRYKDRAEADQVARRLAKEEQLRPEVKR